PAPSRLLGISRPSSVIAHLSTLQTPSLPNVASSVSSDPAPARHSHLRPLITGSRLPTLRQPPTGDCFLADDGSIPPRCRPPHPLATRIPAGYVAAKAPRTSRSSTPASAAEASSLSTRTA